MSKFIGFGKPLSGIASINPSITNDLADSVGSLISSGSLVFSNINITGGTIDGVVIGGGNPGPTVVTTFTSGSPGQGYLSCFYGNIVGDSACWLPSQGQWNIQGDLLARDISDLGHLRISNNTLSSTNINGNINLSPNGAGIVTVNSGFVASTNSGDMILETADGLFTVMSSKDNTLVSGTNTLVSTNNGDITLETGNNINSYAITIASTGTTTSTITTSSPNSFSVGDQISISSTNSTPSLNGVYVISSVLSNNSFTIPLTTPVTSISTTGSVKKTNNILLSATDNIYVPTNVPITFGTTSSVNPSTIVSDGTSLSLSSTNVVINGSFTVNGPSSVTHSTVTTIDDPVFNVGGTAVYTSPDIMDRGISMHYFNSGSDKIGFFGRSNATGCLTYIPDATESNNVYTGAPGCANFGALTVTSIDTQNGSISNIGILNTCSINCAGTLTLTGNTAVTVTSPNVNMSNNLTVSGTLNACTINCSGALSITGSTSVTLTTPNVYIPNNLTVSGTLNACTINCSGALSITGSTSVTLTTPNVYIPNNLTVSGTLNTCTINCSGALSITGSTSVTLTTPNVYIPNNLTVSGTLNACTINCSGALSVAGSTSVTLTTPNVYIPNDLTVSGTLNACTINCSGVFSITGGTSVTLTTPNVYIPNDLTVSGKLNACTINCSGVFSITGGTSVTLTTPNVYIPNNLIVSGTLNACTINCNGNMTITGGTSVTVDTPAFNVPNGTTTVNNLTVTGTTTGITLNEVESKEHITVAGGSIANPTGNVNLTYIIVTGLSGSTAIGTLSAPTVDGFEKKIMCSGIATNTNYTLYCPAGILYDPTTESTVDKYLKFEHPGQSVHLVWNNNISAYIPISASVCVYYYP